MNKIYDLIQITDISTDRYFLIYDQNWFIFKIKRENVIFDLENTTIGNQLSSDYNTIEETSLSLLSTKSVLQSENALSWLSTAIKNYFSSLLDELEVKILELSQKVDNFKENEAHTYDVGYYKQRSTNSFKEISLLSQDAYDTNNIFLSSRTMEFPHGFGTTPQRIDYNISRIFDGIPDRTYDFHRPERSVVDLLSTSIHRDIFHMALFHSNQIDLSRFDVPFVITQDETNVYIKFTKIEPDTKKVQCYLQTDSSLTKYGEYDKYLSDDAQVMQFFREFKWTFQIYKYP